MAKKKKMKNKGNPKGNVLSISSLEVTRAHMPKYNGFGCGYGAHGTRGYNRNQEKKRFQREISWIW